MSNYITSLSNDITAGATLDANLILEVSNELEHLYTDYSQYILKSNEDDNSKFSRSQLGLIIKNRLENLQRIG